jgi:hypothetical protein
MLRKILLPAGLDHGGRLNACHDLVLKQHLRNLVTTGYVHDVFPNECGWINQPGNTDDRRRVYYAYVYTRRGRSDDR